VVEVIGGVVILDFTGYSASERGRIEPLDGTDSADTLFDGLPKRGNPDTDGTNNAQSGDYNTPHSEILSAPYEKQSLTKLKKVSTARF
jgi:hypothetical protein